MKKLCSVHGEAIIDGKKYTYGGLGLTIEDAQMRAWCNFLYIVWNHKYDWHSI